MDEVILRVLGMRRRVTALLQRSEEVSVEQQQRVQAREDPRHAVQVQLQLLQHAPPEDLRHDRQSLDVVQLCLHQLYRKGSQRGLWERFLFKATDESAKKKKIILIFFSCMR